MIDLAEKLEYRRGCDPTGLQRIEQGTKQSPLEVYAEIAAAFEMPLSELFAMMEREEGGMPETILPEERELVSAYRVMEPTAQEHYLAIAKGLAKKG